MPQLTINVPATLWQAIEARDHISPVLTVAQEKLQ